MPLYFFYPLTSVFLCAYSAMDTYMFFKESNESMTNPISTVRVMMSCVSIFFYSSTSIFLCSYYSIETKNLINQRLIRQHIE